MENVIDEIRFAEGFNKAYILFQFEPEIAKSFIENEVEIYDDFSAGFSDGLKQAQQDKTIDEFEQLRQGGNEHENDIDR